MSRTTQTLDNNYKEEYTDGDFENIIKRVINEPTKYDNTERVHLIDADSLFFICTYSPNDEEGNVVELEFDEVCHRAREKIAEISNNVEKWFNIKITLLFVGGKGDNFRYKLYPEYKSSRKTEKPKWFSELKEYLINELGAISSTGAESDDYIYHSYKQADGNCIVSSIDKDLKGFTPGIIYDYRSYKDVMGEFKYITEEESRLFFCSQLITGDSGDSVNMCPKKGAKYAEKVLNLGMSDYQFKKAILNAYIEAWKGDVKLAKDKLRLCYKLLKLHTLEEIEQIRAEIK